MKSSKNYSLGICFGAAGVLSLSGCAMIQSSLDGDSVEAISLEVMRSGPGYVIVKGTAEVMGDGLKDAAVEWRHNGSEKLRVDKEQVIAGEIITSEHGLEVPNGESAISFLIEDEDQTVARTLMRLYGQETTGTPPTIEGNFDDWNDPTTVRVFPEKNGLSLSPLSLSTEIERIHLMTLWAEDQVFLGQRIEWKENQIPESPENYEFKYTFGEGKSASIVTVQLSSDENADAVLEYQSVSLPLEVGISEEEGGSTFIELAFDRDYLSFENEIHQLFPWDFEVLSTSLGSLSDEPLLLFSRSTTTKDRSESYAYILPDPSTKTRSGRTQLQGGKTDVEYADQPSTDPADRTPLPVEYLEHATYLPEGMELVVPFDASHDISNGYGFESGGWTHQTIANEASANDFFALDFGMPIGVPILAAAPGRIITSNLRGDSYGNYMVIDHGGGYHSIYAHLDSLEYYVDKGEPEIYVEAGQVIGKSGKTGTSAPHLHFAVHKNSRISHSGADVGGLSVVPEPMGGLYGLREGHELTGKAAP